MSGIGGGKPGLSEDTMFVRKREFLKYDKKLSDWCLEQQDKITQHNFEIRQDQKNHFDRMEKLLNLEVEYLKRIADALEKE